MSDLSDTDKKALRTLVEQLPMSKRNLFDELKQGLEEICRFAHGEIDLVTHAYDVPDVRAIRQRSGLSQAPFAALKSRDKL